MLHQSNRVADKVHTHWFYLLAILIIYAGLSLYQINLPGLHYDEAFEAVPALQLLLKQPVMPFRGAGLTIGQQTFPLMTQDYIGALNTYAAIPFIAVLGATPAALRTMSILVGAITLLLTTALAYRFTGTRWVGLSAALLLSVDPTFVFWNRQGVFVTAVTATIGVAATYCWLRRFQSSSIGWSIAGAFLFGLGVYAKLLFLWLIFGLIGSMILLKLNWLIKHRTDLLKLRKQLSIVEILAALFVFLLGSWPLIVYNIQTGGTLLNLSQNARVSYYGVDNLAFGANLIERLTQFVSLLNGDHLWYLGATQSNFLFSLLFVVVLVIVVIMTIRNSRTSSTKTPDSTLFSPSQAGLFPFLVIGLVLLSSTGTISALWITHFAILMPWPALALSIGAWSILTNLDTLAPKLNTMLKISISAGISLLVITNLLNTLRYHVALSTSGGLSSHSDAIYDLSDWLAEHAHGRVIAMDWGLAAPVIYLTNGRVAATEVFGYEWQPDTNTQLNERLQEAISQPATLYLWRAPDEIIFDRSDEFKALYRPLNLEETIEEAFYERSGRPILGVTRLVEKGTATNPPQ